MKAAKWKMMVVFLDYDGTLSLIVDDRDHAFMFDEMRAAVRKVAKYFPTTVRWQRCKQPGHTQRCKQ
ncbi:hypothetical protein C1H46_002082 [Malus baccata]|uniref:Uncharacterized protein n=1 Tax=Malus baccata TaxID=106549 RepID=A0A540NN21_MALBA|nr:hypothetical protein C1H46_002082 [Malus baccata]